MFFNPLLLLPLLAFSSATPLRSRTVETTTFGGFPGSNTCGETPAFTFTETAPACIATLTVDSYAAQQQSVGCSWTLFTGNGCPAGQNTSTTEIPAGTGTTCVPAGVYDGGVCSYCVKASALYSCP